MAAIPSRSGRSHFHLHSSTPPSSTTLLPTFAIPQAVCRLILCIGGMPKSDTASDSIALVLRLRENQNMMARFHDEPGTYHDFEMPLLQSAQLHNPEQESHSPAARCRMAASENDPDMSSCHRRCLRTRVVFSMADKVLCRCVCLEACMYVRTMESVRYCTLILRALTYVARSSAATSVHVLTENSSNTRPDCDYTVTAYRNRAEYWV